MDIKGTFEVHIITKPEFQPQLFGYINDISNNKTYNIIRPRPTNANSLYGDYPAQPMLTFFINGDIKYIENVVDNIKKDMNQRQIPIIRVKIEAMAHNNGVPNVCFDEHYFEYHFKIMNINTTELWNKAVKLITEYGCHLFFNPYNKNMTPIATIRRYTSLTDLDEVYQTVSKLLIDNGFELEKPEKEFSYYDSNVMLDRNWLFVDKPQNMITTLSSNMLYINA